MEKTTNRLKLLPFYMLLSLGAVAMVFPFIWMLLTSLKTGADVYSFSMIPNPATTMNYSFVFTRTDFIRWFANSLGISAVVVSTVLMFDTLVGYTLCKMQFRGKTFIFILIMSTLMVPTEMLIIPWYLMSAELKWINTYWSIMFPGLITAFGIFMMRQFFEGVPDELLEAARIDGLNEFGIFARIATPLVLPAVSALAIFTFLGNWNAFLWPVIIISNKELVTLPVGLAMFTTENNPEWERIMTAASLGTLPVLIVFTIFQRQIIEGINLSGMKA